MRFQIGTSKKKLGIRDKFRGERRYLHYAFTEQETAMLYGVLKNEIVWKLVLI